MNFNCKVHHILRHFRRLRIGEKKKEERKKKPLDENIMACTYREAIKCPFKV